MSRKHISLNAAYKGYGKQAELAIEENKRLRAELAATQKRIAELEGRTCETCKHNFGPIHYGVGNSMLVKGWIVCNKLEHAYKTPFSCSAFEPKKEDKT